jgi:DNA polymerase III epsilon subunit-like protein
VTTLAFVDLETTGLDDVHEPWEIALVVRWDDGAEDQYRWFVEPQYMDIADPQALEIGRFAERTAHLSSHSEDRYGVYAPGIRTAGWSDPQTLAVSLEDLLRGAVLVGSNAQFDMRMLRSFLQGQGRKLTCHYRPVDVGAMAYGYLSAIGQHTGGWCPELPWNSTKLAAALGVERSGMHEALPDALFARDVFDAVRGGRRD